MLKSLYSNFKEIFAYTWPMVFVSLVILVSLRLSYLYKSKTKVILYKEIFLFFFAFYILCLFQIVTSTDISASYCTLRWVNGVSPTGTFVRKYRFNGWSEGIDGIPTGWTIEESE